MAVDLTQQEHALSCLHFQQMWVLPHQLIVLDAMLLFDESATFLQHIVGCSDAIQAASSMRTQRPKAFQ